MFYNNYGDYKMKDNKSYPEPSSFKSGNKVAWLYYHNLSDAKKASKLAMEKSKKQISLGYDFGYQAIGKIIKLTDTNGVDAWEVTIP